MLKLPKIAKITAHNCILTMEAKDDEKYARPHLFVNVHEFEFGAQIAFSIDEAQAKQMRSIINSYLKQLKNKE